MQQFAKYGDNKQKFTKSELPTDPAKTKIKSEKQRTENKLETAQAKANAEPNQAKDMRRGDLGGWGVQWRASKGKRH